MKARTLLLTDSVLKSCAKVFCALPAILTTILFFGACCAGAAQRSIPAVAAEDAKVSPESPTVAIPGPLRSFLRMAGISQKVTPEEVMQAPEK